MIKRVMLENWKSHAKSELEFGLGTNLLVGVSGSGKTSVMDAICFALYGTFPLASTRLVKLEEVIMQKPIKRDYATITLDFEYNNKQFEVIRTINLKTSNQATLKENGRLIAGPKPNEVTKRIEEIIDVNYELFSRAIYAEQNQIDYFLKLNPAQRKEKIDDLLMINKYESVRSNAVSMQNRLKKQAEDKKSLLKEIKENFDEKELSELQKKINEKREKSIKAKKETLELKEKLQTENEKIAGLEKKEKEFNFFKDLLLKSETKTQELEKIVLEAKGILKEVSLADLPKQKEQIEIQKKEMEKVKTELQKQKNQLQKKVNEIMQKRGGLQEKTAQKEKQLLELKDTKSNCPVCNRLLEEHVKGELLEETKKEKEKAKIELEELEKNITEVNNVLEKNSIELEKNSKETELLVEKTHKISEKISKAMELEKKEEELKTLLAETKKVQEQMNKMDFSPNALLDQIKLQEILQGKILVLTEQAKSYEEIITQIMQNEKRLNETKKQIAEFEKDCKQLSELSFSVTIFVNALKQTQAELRHSLINTVNEAMNDIWQNIYPYGDFESAKIEINELGNYDIRIKQKNGPWGRVEGILSGGERSCVALTIRIAISLVLTQNLSWLILDEPTHNLDINTIAKLSMMMKNHLPELVEQVFIITHDKEMEMAATASLYFLEREKDSFQPTKPVLQETK